MLSFICPTCESKLIVKDDKLIGTILACPKCGGMVLVQPTGTPFASDLLSDAAPPAMSAPKPVVRKRFPDVLSHETALGVIGHVSEENRRVAVFLDTDSDLNVSETEIKARKILIGILGGLSAFLLLAFGFLMLFQRSDYPLPEPPLPIIEMPGDKIEIPPHIEEPTVEEPITEYPTVELAIEPIPIQEEPVEKINDATVVHEDRVPRMFETAVPNINIDAKLALPIFDLNLNQRSLIEFVRLLSQLTSIPITLDIDAMKPLSLSVRTQVDGEFTNTTAKQVLTETLAALNLQWEIVEQQILISPKESTDNINLTFDVSDLVEQTDDLTPDEIADRVRRLICPDENVAVFSDNRLTIIQDANNRKNQRQLQYEVQRFLEQLRAVRQLPRKTELTAESLAPEAFGWDEVIKPITLNYYQATPLSRAVMQLKTITSLTIIIDHQSLHRAQCPFASIQVTVQCNHGTINDVMELLLASVDSLALAYRIVDHQTLEITTTESAMQPEKMVLEVHRYQLQEDETPEEIVQSLRSAIAPNLWGNGSDIVIDALSSCLFVRQSQPVQRQIRLSLSTPEPLAQ